MWRVAGLASPRSEWFFDLARWATAAAIPVDFVKCMAAAEFRSRLERGEQYSALLVGDDVKGVTRDLVDTIRSCGGVVIVVGDMHSYPWIDFEVSTSLSERFTREELLSTLSDYATPLVNTTILARQESGLPADWQGDFVAVTGSNNAGASTLAMALAQNLAAEASNRGMVLLADLALNADQSVLHDCRDIMPGLQDMIEACGNGWQGYNRLRSFLFEPFGRGYHLLLGLRKHSDWTTLSSDALEVVLDGLTRSYRFVVGDTDCDIEGEHNTGSADIERRNCLARTAITRCDTIVVVGTGDMLGLRSLIRTTLHLAENGVATGRILPVINRCARSSNIYTRSLTRSLSGHTCIPQNKKEVTRAFSELLEHTAAEDVSPPICIPAHRKVEPALRDGVALPSKFANELTKSVASRLAELKAL